MAFRKRDQMMKKSAEEDMQLSFFNLDDPILEELKGGDPAYRY